MTGLIGGCLPIEPLAVAREILKARNVLQEDTDFPDPSTSTVSISESPSLPIPEFASQSISESSVVTIT